MVPVPYRYCFKLFDFFRSCKILIGLVKFKTAPDRMSGNVWEVFVNTECCEKIARKLLSKIVHNFECIMKTLFVRKLSQEFLNTIF